MTDGSLQVFLLLSLLCHFIGCTVESAEVVTQRAVQHGAIKSARGCVLRPEQPSAVASGKRASLRFTCFDEELLMCNTNMDSI